MRGEVLGRWRAWVDFVVGPDSQAINVAYADGESAEVAVARAIEASNGGEYAGRRTLSLGAEDASPISDHRTWLLELKTAPCDYPGCGDTVIHVTGLGAAITDPADQEAYIEMLRSSNGRPLRESAN